MSTKRFGHFSRASQVPPLISWASHRTLMPVLMFDGQSRFISESSIGFPRAAVVRCAGIHGWFDMLAIKVREEIQRIVNPGIVYSRTLPPWTCPRLTDFR
ncbi:hypothetical protein P152DRAFT_462368 [Eremomyces bilateralis CBS 781.70]|uniref:Uncharacterized protein n=1 Tax=Eremomyces bilateralis CBS 781.70 TaxID=1392243 RepID=A0A6G1FSD5_9PEZI|nr:uncharacterized protein P152DRAFT_462368 [Eremomyces bilateralis CBS 781.70]KAF1808646.1 hypothetical protein P152DRAFT_462368 [Eremomyces bilateralis CBS 781.70]